MNVLEIHEVSKQYGKTYALKSVSLTVSKGDVIFLTGSNGSGKTTLIKCILDQIRYKGTIRVFTNDIGYVPEKVNLPDFLTIRGFLNELAHLRKWKDGGLIEAYLKKYHLDEANAKNIHALSKGMRQKMVLIQAFMKDANLFIFDEPLNGLDEEMREVFFDDLKHLRKQKKTILIATHHPNMYSLSKKRVVEFENGELHEKFKDD